MKKPYQIDAQRAVKQLEEMAAKGKVTTATLKERKQNGERIAALTAHRNVDRLFTQYQQFRPDYAVMVDGDTIATAGASFLAGGMQVRPWGD